MSDYVWNTTAAGSWTTTTLWTPTSPALGPTASTDTATIAQNITAATTITAANTGVNKISMQDSNVTHRYSLTNTAATWTLPASGAEMNVPLASTLATSSTFNLNVSGTGALTKTGAGIANLVYDRTLDWSGGLVINAGYIIMGGTPSGTELIGTGSITLNGGSASGIGQNITANAAIGNSITVATSGGALFSAGGFNLSFSGLVSGTGPLWIDGDTTLASKVTVTNASNTYNGTVKVLSGGSLNVSTAGLDYAHLDWGTTPIGQVTFNASSIIGALSTESGTNNALALPNGIYVGSANTSKTFGGAISGAGGITKVGTGKWTLTSSTTTRTGATTVTGGELELTASNAIGNTTASTVIVGSLGTLTLNGTGISVPAKATTLSGLLQNKTGSNTWAGTISTVASETTAEIRNATSGTTLTNNATFGFASGSTLTISGDGDISKGAFQSLSNVGTLVKNGNGTFSLTTFNVYGSTVRLNAGTISITGLTASGAVFEVNGGSFIATSNSNLGFDGSLSGTGGNIACASATARTITVNTGTTNTWSGYFGSAVTNGNNFALTLSTTGTQLVLRNTTSSSTHTGTTTVGAGLTLDGAHTFSSSTVSASTGAIIGAGGWNGTTGGLGDFTVPTLTFSSTTGTIRSSKKDAATAPSKVVVTGALTKPGTTLTIIGAGTGWVAGTAYEVASYGSVSGAGALAMGTWADSVNTRVGGSATSGSVTVIGSSIYMTPGASNVTTTWNGGTAGDWYSGQTTGWTASGPAFLNGDTVTFNATSTVPATLTGNVSVAALTMSNATHTISGSAYSITNSGDFNASGSTQTVNVGMITTGTVYVGTSTTLVAGHANTFSGPGTILDLQANAAAIKTTTSITTARELRLLTTSGSNTIEKTGGSTFTISGAVSGSGSVATRPSVFVKGHGLLLLTATTTGAPYNIYEVSDATTSAGQNVFSMSINANTRNFGLVLGNGGIYEDAQASTPASITRTYGSGANQFQVVSGGGFSRSTTGTTNVSAAITYGTSAATQWVGTAYFGTALGTQQGTVSLSGTQNINGQTQTFHVFNGATTAGSSATVSGKISGSGTIVKAGPGRLTLNNATNDFTASVSVTAGRLTVSNSACLNSQAATLSAGAQLQTQDTSGVALSLASLTAGAGSRIIIGGA